MELGAWVRGRYELLASLGRGGLATTYLARDALYGGKIALKWLTHASPGRREMLRVEFERLRGFFHPNLARVLDFGVVRDRAAAHERENASPAGAFYTSEYIEGEDLAAFAVGRTYQEVAPVLGHALLALRVLHGGGLRHGDVKPSNVLVRRDGVGVLIDLSASAPLQAGTEAWPALTVSGTRDYLAPELLRGERADERADLFAFGVTLRGVCETCGGAPESARRLVDRLTSPRPTDRPCDVDEVLDRMHMAGAHQPALELRLGQLRGRSHELARFEEILASVVADRRGPRSVVLTGPTGCGRTRLLEEMKHRAELAMSVFECGPIRPGCIRALLARACASSLPLGASALVSALSQCEANGPAAFVIDDAERLPDPDRSLYEGLIRLAEDRAPLLVIAADRAAVTTDGSLALALDAPEMEADALAIPTREMDGDALTALEPRQLDALALLAALGASDEDTLERCGIDRRSLSDLYRDGWIATDGPRICVRHGRSSEDLLERLGTERRREAHRFAAAEIERRLAGETVDEGEASVAFAELCRHLSLAGEEARFMATWRRHAATTTSPHAWLPAIRALPRDSDPDILIEAATLARRAGRSAEALGFLARARRRARDRDRDRLDLEAAEVYVALGRPKQTRRHVNRAITRAHDQDERARLFDLTSRALIKAGDYAGALEAAATGLAEAPSDAIAADLHDDLGIAASYRGDLPKAEEHLGAARTLHAQLGNRYAEARSVSYAAFAAYRQGDTAAALTGYRRALGLAEKCDAPDLIATAALNAGVASHQRGSYGEALRLYERGLSLAVALGRTHTELTLRANLAKLFVDIGQLDRAESAATSAEQRASAAGATLISASALASLGETRLGAGDTTGAIEAFERAGKIFADQGASRERIEVEVQLGEARVRQGDHAGAARAWIAASTAAAEPPSAPDIDARIVLLAASIDPMARSDGPAEPTLELLERALALAGEAGQRALQADVLARLSTALHESGAQRLAARRAEEAVELWERMATGLSEPLADAFWRHPERSACRRRTRAHAPTETPRGGREEKLARLLAINRKLSASLDTREVVQLAVDSAIDLTGAERGFVLLVEPSGELVIVARRNIDSGAEDPERFSQTIARTVVETAQPLVTVDAERDGRFEGNASVHAMRLKSVACAPIRAARGIVGALYLDHRYERDIFVDEDVEMLLAFADQVAIALTNAELLGRIVAEQQRVAELAAGRAEQIVRLEEEVRTRQEALEHRYDYRTIVAQSPAMRAVLDKLDRVIATDVSVLIVGESGTGKELLARAIHFNGPRKAGPFVSINCGAVPESLFESELFGHVRGAFTGATHGRDGLLVTASGGTLLLDEIGELPLAMQVKLLRVLQEREVQPVGADRTVPVDVRVVAATHRALRDDVETGRFREDLFYRVGVVEVDVPPLRDRLDDLPLLAQHLLSRAAEHLGREAPRLSAGILTALRAHRWPGNIRELDNVLTRACVLADGRALRLEHLELPRAPKPRRGLSLSRSTYEGEESERMADALRACRFNVAEAARLMRIPRTTFYRKLKRYGLGGGPPAR